MEAVGTRVSIFVLTPQNWTLGGQKSYSTVGMDETVKNYINAKAPLFNCFKPGRLWKQR